MYNRYVGIMVNASTYRRIPSGKTSHESLPCYEEAGRLHGVTPCFFRLKDILPGRSTVKAYTKSEYGYRKREIPVPTVIHNRSLYFKPGCITKIRELVRDGKRIFNEWNRYGKKQIHDLLSQDPDMRPHLPVTVIATDGHLRDMMQAYSALIIKPNSSSIGRGIMKLERLGDGWLLDYPANRSGRIRKKVKFRHRIPRVLQAKLRGPAYLIQECLPLATYRDRPFDLRVTVQRNETGEWTVAGIAAKVARRNVFLTNVAQGGTVYPLEKVLTEYPDLDPVQTKCRIEYFCLGVAGRLSRHLPHLADIGLDVGITKEGKPLFIECNGRDLRICFEKAGMQPEFQSTYCNPIGYAKYLLDNYCEASK